MHSSLSLHNKTSAAQAPERIIKFSNGSLVPKAAELRHAEAVEMDIESLDRFEQAADAVRAIFAEAKLSTPPLLLLINICLADSSREATQRFEKLIGHGSRIHLSHTWYVGTEEGLRGLVDDLRVLGIGDGVSYRTVETAARELAGQRAEQAPLPTHRKP
ncbi:hypothetical protein AB0I35_15500 [Nocardia sp. NPDC050378]|uniref:hypothetical protein n=1 Tax=Nocardia sp. NPDC050378 TaxID=3155400 RepID=UPI003411E4B3